MAELPAWLGELTGSELQAIVTGTRWLGMPDLAPEQLAIVGATELPGDGPAAIVIVSIASPTGTHALCALALAVVDGRVVEAFEHPFFARRLAARAGVRTPGDNIRPIGTEQTNSSVVIDERHVLKLYRRLEPGPNPELEMLRVLALQGYAHAPLLEGWVDHSGPPLETTLALVTGFVPARGDGWQLALASLASEPDWLPERSARLGEVTAGLHSALAAESGNSHFEPEQPSGEAIALLAASLDEEIERVFAELPDHPDLDAIAGRGEDLRDFVGELAPIGPAGLFIRVHGDYHLGQVLWSHEEDWIVIDFEGEPRRPVPERRRRHSPLRDVAGMVRSFSYAADAAALGVSDTPAPPGWEGLCRDRFLDAYRATVNPELLPASSPGADRLLALFEVEKLLYELRYELEHRVDWVGIPAAGFVRLLEGRS